MEIIYSLAVLFSIIGGAGGFYTLYTAKAKKESITIGNLENIIRDLRDEVGDLRTKVNGFEMELGIYKKAIGYGYKCKMCAKDAICPIILSLEEVEEKHKRSKK